MNIYDWDGLPPHLTPDANHTAPIKPYTGPHLNSDDFFDDSLQELYREQLGQALSARFDEFIMAGLFEGDPLYNAYKAGISLPHRWDSIKHKQANLDYLATHYPEYLV